MNLVYKFFFSLRRICEFVCKIKFNNILNELKRKKISLTDPFYKENEIDLLIGEDKSGKLMTGNLVYLNYGLTAVKTKLG